MFFEHTHPPRFPQFPSEPQVKPSYGICRDTTTTKSVEENLGKIDVLASKVDSLALDVDLLKI